MHDRPGLLGRFGDGNRKDPDDLLDSWESVTLRGTGGIFKPRYVVRSVWQEWALVRPDGIAGDVRADRVREAIGHPR